MFSIPLSILAFLTGACEISLRKRYAGKFIGSEENLLPVSILPLDQAELCAKEFLFHGRYLDLDLYRLSAKDFSLAADDPFPLLSSPYIQHFFSETRMLREATLIIQTHAGTKTITEELTSLAEKYGISYRTLMRKREKFMNHSDLSLLLQPNHNTYLYHDHMRSMCLYACDYAIYRHLAVNAPSSNKILREFTAMEPFPCKSCPYSKAWQEAELKEHTDAGKPGLLDIPPFQCTRKAEFMVIPKTRYPINDLLASVSKQDVCMARKGVHEWEAKYHYTPARKKPERVNAVWFGDHTPLDIFVITKYQKDGTVETARVWLTAIMDAASNAMVGYTLTTRPNSASIAEAFARAAVFTVDSPFAGLPEVFYIDNGRDFRSKLISGENLQEPRLNKDFASCSMLEWLGVHVTHALPYRGSSKTIERIFGTIEREWISDLPGWCGNSIENRPSAFAADLNAGRLYSFEQFVSYFADTIWPAYNRFKSTPDKASPLELYESLPKADTLVPSWRTMAVLKYPSKPHTIQSDGIRFNNHWYWHPTLAPYIGEKVHIFAFDAPFHRTISVTLHRAFIAEAHPTTGLSVIEDDRLRVIQHLAEQRKQKRAVSHRLETLRKIVFKTDLLERGMHIPAIEEYSYSQTIDHQRDEEHAIDDNRIPEELKDAALRYAPQLLSPEAESNGKPMRSFMQEIGSSVSTQFNG